MAKSGVNDEWSMGRTEEGEGKSEDDHSNPHETTKRAKPRGDPEGARWTSRKSGDVHGAGWGKEQRDA